MKKRRSEFYNEFWTSNKQLHILSLIRMGYLVAWLLITLAACSGPAPTVSNPTPTPTSPSPTADTTSSLRGSSPTATCDEAVQQILKKQIGLIELYRQKVNLPQLPKDSVTTILIYPRAARSSDGTYSLFKAIDVYPLDLPDRDCYPQLLHAAQQVNAHLSKDQQVVISKLYSVS